MWIWFWAGLNFCASVPWLQNEMNVAAFADHLTELLRGMKLDGCWKLRFVCFNIWEMVNAKVNFWWIQHNLTLKNGYTLSSSLRLPKGYDYTVGPSHPWVSSMGFIHPWDDSIDHGLKTLFLIPESSKKWDLNLSDAQQYAESMQMRWYVSTPYKYRLCAVVCHFCTRNFSIVDFGIHGGPGTNPLWILRDDCTSFLYLVEGWNSYGNWGAK